MSTLHDVFRERGWLRFAPEPATLAWAEGACERARRAIADPANAHWLRCGGTWFVGVDALANDAAGRVGDGPALTGTARDFARAHLPGGDLPLHRAQLSVCYPGYPQPSDGESEAAFRFRVRRDAAHVDGLLLGDPQRRRFLREPHAWILGIGLETPGAGASPTVLWEGSHRRMREALSGVLAGHAPDEWPLIDITEPYQRARREVFTGYPRLEMPLGCGEALLVHRHLLHGIAPWRAAAEPPALRSIAWFRPHFAQMADWLGAD